MRLGLGRKGGPTGQVFRAAPGHDQRGLALTDLHPRHPHAGVPILHRLFGRADVPGQYQTPAAFMRFDPELRRLRRNAGKDHAAVFVDAAKACRLQRVLHIVLFHATSASAFLRSTETS